MLRRGTRTTAAVAMAAALLAGCQSGAAPAPSADAGLPSDPFGPATSTASSAAPSPTPPPSVPPSAPPAAPPPPVSPAPPAPAQWQVGARPLPLRPDGFGKVLPTPPELADRKLSTVDRLPAPAGTAFASTSGPVPEDVLARSTWEPGCPVSRNQLRYVTVSFWGFDGKPHTGELLVNASAVSAVISAFGRLHAVRFPIEEMRVVARPELDLAPTGDGNNTSSFVCRPARGQTRWSAHAYGQAVDINPFCNPYLRGDLVLPELASAYVDRRRRAPGVIAAGDAVTAAFAAVGWTWGGTWRSPKDYMHFSATGD